MEHKDFLKKSIFALSPLDGRYVKSTIELTKYFSEAAYFIYRYKVELDYFYYLLHYLQDPHINLEIIEKFYKENQECSIDDILEMKEIESKINHDVKSIEYLLVKKWDRFITTTYHGFSNKLNIYQKIKNFIHFGLTSQDINHVALTSSIKTSNIETILPSLYIIKDKLLDKSNSWNKIEILGHTHGQPASLTTMGKEWLVFHDRLEIQMKKLEKFEYSTKFGGAVGNLRAHYCVYPDKNWKDFAKTFVERFSLTLQENTTQIEHYDGLAELFDLFCRINTILIDFCRDIWLYISMNYLSQKKKDDEVGSSTMPHKVNPINFENAEGNLQLANSLFGFMARKLPISRLQRDLTDSTVVRNIGCAFGYSLIAYESLIKGIDKLDINKMTLININNDIEYHPEVKGENYQMYLRSIGYENPYEEVKNVMRGKDFNFEDIDNWIDNLAISENEKNKMKKI